MRLNQLFPILSFLLLSFWSCQPKPTGGHLPGTSWQLTAITDVGSTSEIAETLDIYIEFDEGKLNGKGVCNRYFAEYITENAQIEVGPIGATKMLCPQDSDLEQQYFDLLSEAETYSVKEESLEINCTGESQLIFKVRETPPTSPGNTNREGVSLPMMGSYATEGYPEGYWQMVTIASAGPKVKVIFTASEIKDRPGCSFEGTGVVQGEKLQVPVLINDSLHTHMVIQLSNDTLKVDPENFEERFSLNYFCSGGASLMGDYFKISARPN